MDYRACRDREDGEGTPFRNWIRKQRGLESNTSVGFIGTDLDLVWYNYRLALLMLLEEKQHMGKMTPAQEAAEYITHQVYQSGLNNSPLTLKSLRKPIPPHVTYCGWHLIQFENTSPDDGRIFLNGEEIGKEQFIKFLRFEWIPVFQYPHMAEQMMIREVSTRSRLDEATQHIKQVTRGNSPRYALLRTLWQEKKRELERIEALLANEAPRGRQYFNDPEMEEAERLLRERDRLEDDND